MVIYKTINLVNGKIYIGKDKYNNPMYIGSGVLLKKAIKKYGKENFIKEILEECSNLEELSKREIYWIEELNAIKEGYNIAIGGCGGNTIKNHPSNSEIREKMSNTRKNLNIKPSSETLDKMELARKETHPGYGTSISHKDKMEYNKKHSDKLKEYWSKNIHPQKDKTLEEFYGEIKSNEIKKKISDKLSGENHYNWNKNLPEDIKLKIKQSCLKSKNKYPIIIIDSLGHEIIVESMKEAEEYVKGSRGHIKKCLTGNKSTYKGYKFKYKRK